MAIIKDYRPTSRFVYILSSDPVNMTRIKHRRLDKIRAAFGSVDKSFVNRGDLHDQSKIQQLEEKMNEIEGFEDFNKINFGTMCKSPTKKMNLKNSKRY